MKKYFLREDNGNISYNDFNIARMNWFEMLKYGKAVHGLTVKELVKNEFLEVFTMFFTSLFNILILIFLPISLPIINYFIRKKSREHVFKMTGVKSWKKKYLSYTNKEIMKMKANKGKEND